MRHRVPRRLAFPPKASSGIDPSWTPVRGRKMRQHDNHMEARAPRPGLTEIGANNSAVPSSNETSRRRAASGTAGRSHARCATLETFAISGTRNCKDQLYNSRCISAQALVRDTSIVKLADEKL